MKLSSGEIDEIERCFQQVGQHEREVLAKLPDESSKRVYANALTYTERRRGEILASLRNELGA